MDPVLRTAHPDATLRRLAPRVWLGGVPPRLLRLTDHGDRVLQDMLRTGRWTPASTPEADLLDRLVLAGAAHPEPEPGPDCPPPSDVTVVVPVRDRTGGLVRLLHALAPIGSASPERRGRPERPGRPVGRVVVVDDGSIDHAEVATLVERHGATLVRHPTPLGPAAARNAGLAVVRTTLTAFVDSDVRCEPGWLEPLLAQLRDHRVAIVAPRVRSAELPGVLARYERDHSPLDLGGDPAQVRPRGRVSYLPAAALLARTEVMRELGGFDASMRFGEDVDLIWRAVRTGCRVRYEPASVVTHDPRPHWRAWAAQRFSYGSSAALLDRRHPGAAAPVVLSSASAGVWSLVALGHPVAGLAVGTASGAALKAKLPEVPIGDVAALALSGHLAAGRQLARGALRPWWPLTAFLACVSPRVRRVAAVSLLADLATSSGPASTRIVALADDMLYGAGVWWGAIRERRVGALLPVLLKFSVPPRR